MKFNVYLFLLALGLTASCGVCRRQPTVIVRDSVRTEIREVVSIKRDTVKVVLPVHVERVVVRDSSFLENDFAVSRAAVDESGLLHHSLETKRVPLTVPVEVPETRRDSIVYIDKVREIHVPVIKEKSLTWWQKTRLGGFWVLLAAVGAWAAAKLTPAIKNIIRIIKIPFS